MVTQGTDTIEETAFFLDMTVGCDTPIVVTGAMRAASHAGADGPANLLAAIQVAASDEAAGQGALVVFNDEIHAARLVRKTHTTSPGHVRLRRLRPLGLVVEGKPRLLRIAEARAEPADRRRSWPSARSRSSRWDSVTTANCCAARRAGSPGW